ncbi:hypothetical protein ABK040_013770 [Willaertia magna]
MSKVDKKKKEKKSKFQKFLSDQQQGNPSVNKSNSTEQQNVEIGQRRFDMLKAHLNPTNIQQKVPEQENKKVVTTNSTTTTTDKEPTKLTESEQASTFSQQLFTYTSPFSPKELKHYQKVLQAMKQRPDLFHPFDLDFSRKEKLDLNIERMKYLVLEKKCFSMDTVEHDIMSHFAATAAVASFSNDLSTKIYLQFNFWGGSLLSLGTEKHRKYIEKIDNLEYMGCYGLTELSHGSNVKGVTTTATYCKESGTFEINSPSYEACKWWIGNTRHCHFALVYAQLVVDNVNHGVHCFIVPIRDVNTNEILPGVVVGDCSVKEGLNFLDNGFLMFKKVHIPRENLLDKHGEVTLEGKYVTPYKSANQRFGAMLSSLTMGRSVLTGGSCTILAKCLTTCIGYSFERRQFGISNRPEYPVINFQSQQNELYPMLAQYFAFKFGANHVLYLYANRTPNNSQELHVTSAGFKAYISDVVETNLVKLREKCGGLGYALYNRIAESICNHDIFKTFEGDNVVLLQEVSKFIVGDYKKTTEQKYSNIFSSVGYYVLDSLNNTARNRNLKNSQQLYDHNYYLSLFQFKYERQTQSAAQRLRNILEGLRSTATTQKIPKSQKKEIDSFNAWNMVQCQLIEASKGYIEFTLLNLFHKKVEECTNKNVQKLLKKLLNIFIICLIEKNLSYFLTHEVIKPETGKLIIKEKAKLISQLTYEEVIDIVRSFNLDELFVPAPIANYSNLIDGKVSTIPSPVYPNVLKHALKSQAFGNANEENLGLMQ